MGDEIQYVPIEEKHMKTYAFKVVLEKDKWPDEPDEKAVWRAYIPILEEIGAATFGHTKEEALKNIQEVLEMIIEELTEEGKPIPEQPQEDVAVFEDSRIAVMV